MVLANYLGIFLFIVMGFLVATILVGAAWLFSPSKPEDQKSTPYECGFEEFGDARVPFDIRYYLIAMVFILFDLEVAFLFPWALVLKDIGMSGFLAMLVFLLEFIVILAYLWKKGVLDWD